MLQLKISGGYQRWENCYEAKENLDRHSGQEVRTIRSTLQDLFALTEHVTQPQEPW